MTGKYDAIIIGAGIIGCCIAFELSKKGYKTLNVDKLAAAGHGSTSNSCSVIRLHYSTPDGVAMARDGFFYWLDWENYLEVSDPSGLNGFYMAVGTSGNQYKNAPVAGALMAYLIEKVEAGHDHDRDPVQYPLKYVNRRLNLATFSRLREINLDSSFSVIG